MSLGAHSPGLECSKGQETLFDEDRFGNELTCLDIQR